MKDQNERIVYRYPEWIPVTERLPDTREKMLVCLENKQRTIAYYKSEDDVRGWYSGLSLITSKLGLTVTHWMPLPNSPGEMEAYESHER